MMENTVVITAEQYAELVIKAHKYEQLRKDAVSKRILLSDVEKAIFDLTAEEEQVMKEREVKLHETLRD